MTEKLANPRRPYSKTRQNLRERLMREQVDHCIKERWEQAEKRTNAERINKFQIDRR
jgi:hypothetical protein